MQIHTLLTFSGIENYKIQHNPQMFVHRTLLYFLIPDDENVSLHNK